MFVTNSRNFFVKEVTFTFFNTSVTFLPQARIHIRFWIIFLLLSIHFGKNVNLILLHLFVDVNCGLCANGLSKVMHLHYITCTILFLAGLNEKFFVVGFQILLTNPLPNINKILSMVVQYERQTNILYKLKIPRSWTMQLNYATTRLRMWWFHPKVK